MNIYTETIRHFTLADMDYSPLLEFCITAAVNIMISFPDVPSDSGGRRIPFDDSTVAEPFVLTERKLKFGLKSAGIEVTLRQDEIEGESVALISDSITAETYGLPEKQRVTVLSVRDACEPCVNRRLVLEVSAPDYKAPAVTGIFKSLFSAGDPDDRKIELILESARSKLLHERWDTAADDASYILQHRPDNPEAVRVLGLAERASGDWRKAKKYLLKAVEKIERDAVLWYNLGLAYISGEESQNAIVCFEKALEIDPEYHAAYYSYGATLERMGRDIDAVQAYRYCVKFSPDSGCPRGRTVEYFTPEAKEALARLGSPWSIEEELPPPEGSNINEDLMRAAKSGDIRSVKILVKKGAMVNYSSPDSHEHGRNPLITAAINGHKEVVLFLLKHGADIDAADSRGCHILGLVLEWGCGDKNEIIRILIGQGADADQEDPYHNPVILHYHTLTNADILKELIDAGADMNSVDEHGANILIRSVDYGAADSTRFILDRGAEVNSSDNSGYTPLMAAARRGDIYIMRLLLERGGDINRPDSEGRTPLIIASEHGNYDCIKLLVESGADVNLRNRAGRSALDMLMETGRGETLPHLRRCVDLLTDAGAELFREFK